MENGNSLKKLVINVKPEAENDENFSLNFPPAKALASCPRLGTFHNKPAK